MIDRTRPAGGRRGPPAAPGTAPNILSVVRRRLVPLLAGAAVLSACGGSGARVRTFAPYTGPPVPPVVHVSSTPALQVADRLCRATIPGLRPLVQSTYTNDPQSQTPADLSARDAALSAAAQRWRSLARGLAGSTSGVVRGLASGYDNLAAGVEVLARATGELPTLGGNANVPGAYAAVVTDIAAVVSYTRNHGLPDCVP